MDAIKRLNFYKSFVIHRDSLFNKANKHCAFDTRIGNQQPILARLDGVTPWKACAGRTCRLTYTFVRSCHSALRRLYNVGLVPLAEDWRLDRDVDPNARFMSEGRSANLIRSMNDHIDGNLKNGKDRDQTQPLAFLLMGEDVDVYHETLYKAREECKSRMDEYTTEWNAFFSTVTRANSLGMLHLCRCCHRCTW